jgi:type VI secretion system secreted protein Hcp
MAFDIFLQIDGIKGESTDKDHKDWIEVLSYAHSISQAASAVPSPSGGGGAGKVTHQEFVITKNVDVASPILYQACATGKHFLNVVIDVSRATGRAPVKYMTITMKDVFVSTAALSAPSANDSPIETIALNYGSIQWAYAPQNPDGSIGTVVTGTWGRAIS